MAPSTSTFSSSLPMGASWITKVYLSPVATRARTENANGRFTANIATLPKLNVKQLEKLKQLSLITLASRGTEYLTYSSLLRELDLPNIRLLEDLVISATYANLITAKLDTASQFVDVTSTAGRDVAPEKIPRMIEVLNMWCEQCDDVLADIDEQMRAVTRDARLKKKEAAEYEELLKEKKEALKGDEKPAPATSQGKGKRVIGEGADDGRYEADDMDVDEPTSHGHVEAENARLGANASRRRARGRVGNKRR
jgi:COP9 signalosome complex subunit 7